MNLTTPSILQMRGEIQVTLRKEGIDSQDLIFLDKVLTRATESNTSLNLVLVDHNELSGRWKRQYPHVSVTVEAIIDHHADAGQFLDASPRIITACGSNTSLIVHQTAHANLDGRHGIMMDRLTELAPLMLKTIVFDTVNLTWRQNLVDEEAVHKLQLLMASEALSTSLIMQELEEAVDAVPETNFGIFDLLHKDYKLYFHHSSTTDTDVYYGISTLHLPLESMFDANDAESIRLWHEQVRLFMSREEIEILVVTDAIREKGSPLHRQQLGIFAPSPKVFQQLETLLQAKQCNLSELVRGETFGLYDQENITISRKQLHPIMKEFMSNRWSCQ